MRKLPTTPLFFVVLFAGLIGASLLLSQTWIGKTTGVSGATSTPPITEAAVELVPVKIGRATERVHAVGTLEANESVMIRPEIGGVVKRVLFTEGQAVEKGMVLIELDDAELQAHVAEAVAQLKIARLTYNRMKQLEGSRNTYVSQQQVDQAMSNLGTAEANHSLYLTRLAKTKIRAPFAGYVGIRHISPGDYVQAGQDLVNLEDLRTLKIDFKVAETYLNRLSIGQHVEITTDAYPQEIFTGEVYVVDPRVDASSRALHVRAHIPNTEAKLRPGLFANVELVIEQHAHALLIPEEAVIPQREKTFVYRVLDRVAHWTEVRLGIREQGFVQVLDGLREQDTVVRVGHHKLKDGMRVAAQ